MVRILIVDDHPLFRRALAQAVREAVAGVELSDAGTLDHARQVLAGDDGIDLVLLDLELPGSRGLMGLAALRAEFPAVAMVMISAHEDPGTIRRALACGAMGYIPKSASPEQLTQALRTVLDCREYIPPQLADEVARGGGEDGAEALARRLARLTPQQHRVLAQVAEGRLNKQIAYEMGIQERTVKAHLTAIFERLGVRNRTQAGVALRSLANVEPNPVEPG